MSSNISYQEKEENKNRTTVDGSESLNSDSFNVSSIYQRPNMQSFVGQGSSTNDGEQKRNIWSDLLDNVGSRQDIRQTHVIVLGDYEAGKRSLLKAMNKPFLKKLGIPIADFEEYGSDFAPFQSSFLYIRDISDLNEDTGA